ncbi:MAG: hypothetical protein RMA76_44760 [Deltaproteobacteria bacterium]|jgi:hypothetical protein
MNDFQFNRLFTVTLFVAAACSGADSPDPTPVEPVERTFCEAMTAGCKVQISCGAVVYNHATTVEACVEQTGCAAFTKPLLTDLGVALDVRRLDACIDVFEGLECDQVAALRFGFNDTLAMCDHLAKGTAEEGAECSGLVFDDCGEDLECTYDLACPGTCRPRAESCTQGSCGAGQYCSYAQERCVPLGAIGEACEQNFPGDDHRVSCAVGSFCAYQETGDSLCAETIAKGSSCEACSDPSCCERGSYCEYGDGSAAPVCVDRAARGEGCFFAAMCNEGLFCDFDTNTCATPAGEGGACNGSSGGCQLGLVCADTIEGGLCSKPDFAAPERAELLDAGDACDASSVCAIGLTCVDANGDLLSDFFATGTCERALAVAGTTCSSSIDAHACAEGLCDFATETCPSRKVVGEVCANEGLDTGCPFGLCLGGKCAAADELVCDNIFGAGR